MRKELVFAVGAHAILYSIGHKRQRQKTQTPPPTAFSSPSALIEIEIEIQRSEEPTSFRLTEAISSSTCSIDHTRGLINVGKEQSHNSV